MTKITVEVEIDDPKVLDLYQAIALLEGVPLGVVIGDCMEAEANIYADGDNLMKMWEQRYYSDKPEYARITA